MATDRLADLEQRTRYEPREVERRVFARWEQAGIFHPEPDDEARDNYSIAVPPPNVTGALHMGHALNGSIQDVLIRLARMRGHRTRWIFGTDHAGIATQVKVEEQLKAEGTTREAIGREAFVRRVWEWRERYGSTIVEQYKRLGASADYEDERFTMDPAYARAVAHVFVGLFERGLVYRDNYMVNWDPGTRSAISDLEVEQRPVEDTLYSIDYPLESGSGSITVATVRPETMLADTAVAVHPDDPRYTRLVGESVVLPLVGRRLKVIADPYVQPEFGTGALKITPGHDPQDFEIGRRHGLEEVSVIGEDGTMTAAAGPRFEGLDIDAAREAVVAALREEGRVSSVEPLLHDVPFSHRSGRRIEPLISLQWFCDMERLAAPAIACVHDGRLRFHPERPWTGVYLDWLGNIRPWCISRQLWWGHQLPVWYCRDCEETFVAEREPERCGACDGELVRDPDVLDTWFSSGLWPFATLGWPERTPALRAFYPTDVLSTARDIIFLWVARMVMLGIEFTGEVPFAHVNVHSVIQAPDGRRMSKSLGTGIDPDDEIQAYGADAVRFGLLAMSSSQDVRYSAEKVRQGRDLANKLWNASRLILLRVDDVPAEPRPQTPEDRWIVSRLEQATERVTAMLDDYDLSHAALDLYAVFWGEVCDWYLELVKPRLYADDDREDVSATLLWVLERTLTLLHPVMPFVTEEILVAHARRARAARGRPVARGAPRAPRPGGRARGRRGGRGGHGASPLPHGGGHPGRGAGARAPGGRGLRPDAGARRAAGAPDVGVGRGGRGRRLGRHRAGRHGHGAGRRRRVRGGRAPAGGPAGAARGRGGPCRGQARQPPLRRARAGRRRGGRAGEGRPPEARARRAAVTFAEAERYLLDLELFGMRFGLDRMHRLMTVLGMPQRRFASVHVVGTNGKSSTVRMIAALLERHGVRTGSYTSPHLTSFRERVEVGEAPVGEAEFAAAVERAAHAAALVDRRAPADDRVTQFEALTAAAYHELARRGVDVAVVEAGLGGRWDATNVIPSRVQVLTGVGLEHTRWLGPRVEDIAEEKLAVVRDHGTLVCAPLSPEVEEVARRIAAERSARLVLVDPAAEATWPLRARGSFQRANFAVARASAEAFLGRLDPQRVRAAAASVEVPGRLQEVGRDPLILLDGAHNPAGARALADALPELLRGRKLVLVLGILDDKDAAAMLAALLPLAGHAVLTRSRNPRSLSPATLESLARRVAPGVPLETSADPLRALDLARARAGRDGAVLATGSIYLVADLVRAPGAESASAL